MIWSGATADGDFDLPASPTFVDVLIPLTNPTLIGTGASVNDVTAIGLTVEVPSGGTWTIDGVEAVPEPSTLLLAGRVCWWW
jgi:hypothetical protein